MNKLYLCHAVSQYVAFLLVDSFVIYAQGRRLVSLSLFSAPTSTSVFPVGLSTR